MRLLIVIGLVASLCAGGCPSRDQVTAADGGHDLAPPDVVPHVPYTTIYEECYDSSCFYENTLITTQGSWLGFQTLYKKKLKAPMPVIDFSKNSVVVLSANMPTYCCPPMKIVLLNNGTQLIVRYWYKSKRNCGMAMTVACRLLKIPRHTGTIVFDRRYAYPDAGM